MFDFTYFSSLILTFSFNKCAADQAMHNLAKTYSDLDRNQEARTLKEQVLEFRQRTLPADHPLIGDGLLFDLLLSDSL